jgi:hypothetical protein
MSLAALSKFKPFFRTSEYVFNDFPSKVSYEYTSSTISKINNHPALIISGESENYNVIYLVIFTDYTYALTKVIYRSNRPSLFKDKIANYFSYDDSYLDKYSKKTKN